MDKVSVKFDVKSICDRILSNVLDAQHLDYTIDKTGEITFSRSLSTEEVKELEKAFGDNGIYFKDKDSIELVQRIRDCISSILNGDDLKRYKLSTLLSERLDYSYAHLSTTFTNEAYTSIESYFILQKIDKAKELMINKGLSLTEIAYRLDYSSVAHLSSQFKKHTGLTPSMFQKYMVAKTNLVERY